MSTVMARFRPWRLLRRVPAAVWLITVLFTLLLAAWSALTPQYHAPDEPHHVDAVMRLARGEGWPPPGHATVAPETVGSLAAAHYGSADEPYQLAPGPFPADDAVPRDDRPQWRELPTPGQPAGEVQQMMQHPPLYYLIGAGVLKLLPGAPEDLRFDLVIGVLRLMSVLMVAPLPLLAWAAADRLTDGSRVAGRVAALVPLAVPMLTHIGASVNNDALVVLAGGLATVAICYVLRGDTSVRTACWLGLFVGLAMLAKSLGVVFVPLAVLAYLLAWRRARRAVRTAEAARSGDGPGPGGGPADTTPFLLSDATAGAGPDGGVPDPAAARFPWRPLLAGSVLALAAGGWWFVVNLVRYQEFQPETPGFPLGTRLDGWGEFLDVLVNGTLLRWWGEFGWFEANVPELAARIGTGVVAVLVAVGIANTRGRRVDLALMLWPTIGLFGLMTLQSALKFADTSHVSGISGRYLFGGLAALAAAIGAGAAATGRFGRVLPPLVLAAAIVMQALAVWKLFDRWWLAPDDDPLDGVDALLAWSPWPELAVQITAGLLAVTLLATIIWSLVFAIRRPPEDRPGRSLTVDRITTGDLGDRGGYDWFGTRSGQTGGLRLPDSPTVPDHTGGLRLSEAPTRPDHTGALPTTSTLPRRSGAHRHRRSGGD